MRERLRLKFGGDGDEGTQVEEDRCIDGTAIGEKLGLEDGAESKSTIGGAEEGRGGNCGGARRTPR